MGCGASSGNDKKPPKRTEEKRPMKSVMGGESKDTPTDASDVYRKKSEVGGGARGSIKETTISPTRKRIPITTKQMELVQLTWSKVRVQDNAGKKFFDILLQHSLEVKQIFVHRNVDTESLGRRFINMIDKAVSLCMECLTASSTKEVNQITQPLARLGELHTGYGVLEHHYAGFWRALQMTLSQTPGLELEKDEKAAWRCFYTFLSKIMVMAHRREVSRNIAQRGARLTATQQKARKQSIELPTQAHVDSVGHVFDSLEGKGRLDGVSTTLWAKLFAKNTTLKQLFEVGEGTDSCPMVQTIRKLAREAPVTISNVDLFELGVRHSLYGVKRSNYSQVTDALLESVEPILPSERRSFQVVLANIFSVMTCDGENIESMENDEFPDPLEPTTDTQKRTDRPGIAALLQCKPGASFIRMLEQS
eukprot:Sspe_Gene.18857::Locus_6819_Transcript_1_1_Confidence_1.000_Length_1377::g.18857::m.18857